MCGATARPRAACGAACQAAARCPHTRCSRCCTVRRGTNQPSCACICLDTSARPAGPQPPGSSDVSQRERRTSQTRAQAHRHVRACSCPAAPQAVGDGTGVKPIYESQMEYKGLPFLEPSPDAIMRHVTARECCGKPPVTFNRVERVSDATAAATHATLGRAPALLHLRAPCVVNATCRTRVRIGRGGCGVHCCVCRCSASWTCCALWSTTASPCCSKPAWRATARWPAWC